MEWLQEEKDILQIGPGEKRCKFFLKALYFLKSHQKNGKLPQQLLHQKIKAPAQGSLEENGTHSYKN
ncbi:MAG: hypothetical protein A3F67_11045 [Verrucomicrobia bacterium RIFCSPHIGHO2_12_FULL_41_10]|nr:MAG: hypothetical protein A3F67_11045 [Verrucomicrobia bacterium RIFCSPHIGHO2_12_FULL_41_10]